MAISSATGTAKTTTTKTTTTAKERAAEGPAESVTPQQSGAAAVDPAAVFEPGARAKAIEPAADAVSTSPRAVAERYFAALNARDSGTLDALYAKDARFDDNVFHFRDSAGILGMWGKLPKDARVEHRIESVDGDKVTARLEWRYTLAGKQVHNSEVSRLTIVDGKIREQREQFDFGAWAHQLAPIVPAGVLRFAEPVLAPLLRALTS